MRKDKFPNLLKLAIAIAADNNMNVKQDDDFNVDPNDVPLLERVEAFLEKHGDQRLSDLEDYDFDREEFEGDPSEKLLDFIASGENASVEDFMMEAFSDEDFFAVNHVANEMFEGRFYDVYFKY